VAVKGKTVGPHIRCPKCLAVGALRYTPRRLARGSHWPGYGGIEHRETPLPECRCTICQKRFRVLPVEIAPRKSYTRPVIETACATYAAAKCSTISLRQTVMRMGKNHPHPSALHGWLDGLGARALGRLDRHDMGPPVGALIAESTQRLRAELLSFWTHSHAVCPHKYRSPQRRDRLEACARLFATASRLFPQTAYPWSAWEGWLESRFHVTAWGFHARLRCTAIQQHGPRSTKVQCAPSVKEPQRQRKGKAHGARSPP